MMAHSSLRIMTPGNYHGDDSLRVKDLPEMRIEDGTMDLEQIPAMLIVAGASPFPYFGNSYFGFYKPTFEEYKWKNLENDKYANYLASSTNLCHFLIFQKRLQN